KTGTSQLPNLKSGEYSEGRTMYSFLGMAHKDDPQIIAYVSVTNPELEDDEVGSMITSDIFKSVVENSLHYLNVDPEEGSINDVKQVEMPDLVDKTKREAEKALKDFDKVHFVGEGKTVKAVNVEAGKDIYEDRKSTRLNSSHVSISYAVFCLK